MNLGQTHRRSAGRTQQGHARLRNEDAYLDCPQSGCWAVADGMGGHQAGDVASRWVINSLASLPARGGLDQRVQTALRCLQDVNRRLVCAGAQLTTGHDVTMGSTVVALLVEAHRAVCIWAGDSRCYLWRGRRLYQLSKDHTLLQRLVDEGRLGLSQARAHPDARALTRAIGAGTSLSLETLELGTRPGDVFLLCTDGLYQLLGNDDLVRALSNGSPQQSVDRLFTGVLRGAARDDFTAVVVRP
ncbi:serine/threonine-protein phosphatase [Pseudomonas tolaasii]|uniref:Serine/threonine-protein phosphatase n=2 Tax=Pseudomonas tolaasii TaxID=29442 RepID=A0A7Y8DPX5_PSETO|nr:PP2C family serine/threonine-protein phosphatase [Pseudomonas tolaasii]ARB29268.1 protein phosphatase [Pseudomonas tolaasii]KAB0471010.1 serine/threonine-protein phosphatase [Pseudomonas tolaasii]MBY8939324.1 serine/threonine-protein phosphatase [Pseudomonas tolaasii]NWC18982.1 serine/threonine-protein phosphatase [Pseudomonas tolaasii]NWC42188.1 serine/threonine-protein phosphatase [Pseudomonas tolaasii]